MKSQPICQGLLGKSGFNLHRSEAATKPNIALEQSDRGLRQGLFYDPTSDTLRPDIFRLALPQAQNAVDYLLGFAQEPIWYLRYQQ